MKHMEDEDDVEILKEVVVSPADAREKEENLEYVEAHELPTRTLSM